MADPILWLKSSNGLNNYVDSTRVAYDPRSGVVDLIESVNVVHDYTGEISRRLGFEATSVTLNCHSLFCDGGVCLFVAGTGLFILGGDYTKTGIRNVTEDARMSYAQAGDKVYYLNGYEKGIVQNGVSVSWSKPNDVRYKDSTRQYVGPPLGTIVRAFGSHILIVKGSVLWYSEPFSPNVFDAVRGYISLPSKITMVRPVKQGVYLGTAARTYFYRGLTPREFTVENVSTFPVIERTDIEVDGANVVDGKLGTQTGAIWVGVDGVYFGNHEGTVFNLTRRKLTYPKALSGSGLYNGKEFRFTLEP